MGQVSVRMRIAAEVMEAAGRQAAADGITVSIAANELLRMYGNGRISQLVKPATPAREGGTP